MSSSRKSLDSLRRDIDKIDDGIHDLIMRRAALVEEIRALKGGDGNAYLRPAREAQVLRRLIARHEGIFPKNVLMRIWRELMSALVRLQGPFSVAVFAPEGAPAYRSLAREHFGSFTPMIAVPAVEEALRLVADGSATVGGVPWPPGERAGPWWPMMTSIGPNAPRVIARLPFTGTGPKPESGWNDATQAIAVAAIEQEESAGDHSIIFIETDVEISRTGLKTVLEAVGIGSDFIAFTPGGGTPSSWQYLVETTGFVSPQDERITQLSEIGNLPITRVLHVGGYADPLTLEDLASSEEKALT